MSSIQTYRWTFVEKKKDLKEGRIDNGENVTFLHKTVIATDSHDSIERILPGQHQPNETN